MEENNRKMLLVSASIVLLLIVGSSVVFGVNFTGWFKAFDKTLAQGEVYERNITVRKYYNLSVRFQKEGSTSYLGFTDDDANVVLKDAAGVEVLNRVGVDKGRIYETLDARELEAIATVTATSISDYEDVIDQAVTDASVSFVGSKAYLTVTVHERVFETSIIKGVVFDDLTGQVVNGAVIAAFDDGAATSTATPQAQNTTSADGEYLLAIELDGSKALDVYVDGYDVV